MLIEIMSNLSCTRKSIAVIHMSVVYYIEKVAKTDPQLAQYLSEHVVIGNPCYWSEEPRKWKNKPKVA